MCKKVERHMHRLLKASPLSGKETLQINEDMSNKYMIDLQNTKLAIENNLRASQKRKSIERVRRPLKTSAKNLIPLHHPELSQTQAQELQSIII